MKEHYKKESPFVSLLGLGGGGTGLAFGGVAGPKTYVDDVFSTYVYDGNGGSQQIQNGIDLASEGGIVWDRKRDAGGDPRLFDRTGGNLLATSLANGKLNGSFPMSNYITYNSDGFTFPNDSGGANTSNTKHVAWTFRKCPGFFDTVTWTGNGNVRTIPHNLGSVPGMILIKMTSSSDSWIVYHRSTTATDYLMLNQTTAATDNDTRFNDTEPTSTHFTIGTDNGVNQNGQTFVAYLFAHDDQSFGTSGNQSIVKCGSFTTDGASSATINLGFEPQWIMYKRSDGGNENWQILDTMRGWSDITSGMQEVYANSTSTEATNNGTKRTSTGFRLDAGHTSNATYIYCAIRRPHKPPSAATEVFKPVTWTGQGSSFTYSAGFPMDLVWHTYRSGSSTGTWIYDRARGNTKRLISSGTSSEDSANFIDFDKQNSVGINGSASGYNGNGENYIHHLFRRAPGFMDVVTYTGNNTARSISHNLEAVPELMIVKDRSRSEEWMVYSAPTGATKWLRLHTDGAPSNDSQGDMWGATTPTSSVFSLGNSSNTNHNGSNIIAYLFASLTGISKVGSYTGNGSAQDIDCGFTNGARFVMIKRADDTGDWYVWDSTRGINAGNDPYFLINADDAEVTSSDRIDPLNAGFRVDTTFNDLNANGGTYLYLAIA